MFLVYWSDGAKIFACIWAILIMAALGVFLFFRIRREYHKYRDENSSYIEGILSKNEINSVINAYLSKITPSTSFTLMMLNVDHFSNVIKAFGEKNTQPIIETLISNISKTIPFKIQVGRYGTDEFLMFLKTEYTRQDVVNMAQDILQAVREPISIASGVDVNLTASIGITFYPVHGESLSKLLDSLNIAVYVAKKDGGDQMAIYSSEMSQKESENIQYYTQIKQAIANNQFCLYYQPIINLVDKKVFGSEALIRWEHPELGLINPHMFLNVMEQSGDINWIGEWSIEVVVAAYNDLKRIYPHQDFYFSINLSPKQLMNPHLAVQYQKILKRYKMNAKFLIIEVEEFVMFQQLDIIRQNINKLKELGFRMAVDGFSLDHNTLGKIKDLPIDIIKIPQTFVQDEDNYIKEHYMEMLVEFAKQQNIDVIAERIENEDMINFCLEKEIKLGQGFGICEPISFDNYIKFIAGEYVKPEEN